MSLYKLLVIPGLCLLTLTAAWAQEKMPSAALPALSQTAEQRPIPPAERYALGPAPQANLGAISDALRQQPSPRGLLRVAAHRLFSTAQMSQGIWQKTAGSPVWRLNIRSQDAVGIRVHFTNFSVGAGQVWVHDTASPAQKVLGPFTGTGRNKNGDFWTGVIFGDAIEIEYQPEAGSAASGPPSFQIAEVAHLWQFGRAITPRQSTNSFTIASQTPQASSSAPLNFSCLKDASCYSDPASSSYIPAVGEAVRSTAIIVFEEASGTYECTATLLNAPNGKPLLLTAGHCITEQKDAQTLIAFFNAVDQTCQQPPFTTPSREQLNQLPWAYGSQLLSSAQQPFIDEEDQTEIQTDLDYSLVLLQGFPEWPNTALSGYTAAPVADGEELTSVSAPYGLFLKAASTRVFRGLWANGFDADQTTSGRVGPGSSGSGVFNSDGELVGVASTAMSPCNGDSSTCNLSTCDVNGEFGARYTAFSSIYPIVRSFLNEPIPNPGTTIVGNPGVFSASPITNINALGFGDVTLTMNAPVNYGSQVEIHVGSPNGALFYRGVGRGTVTARGWVTEGMVFYLQDTSDNNLLILADTIATVTAHASPVTFTATPPVILYPDALGNGSMTLNWTDPGARLLEVHIGSPEGTLFTQQGGPSGSARATGWVSDGLAFVLCDVSNGPCSAQNTVATLTAHVASDSQSTIGAGGGSSFEAWPNPIVTGQPFEQAMLSFDVPGASTLQIRVGSPTGTLFAQVGASGTAWTGYWVTDGMTFYLQDISNGTPGTTVATTTVHFARY